MITGREHRDETVSPTFDILKRLRARRLRWAGHILRSEESNLLRRVLLAEVRQDLEAGCGTDGGLLMDAPAYSSVEELLESVGDRKGWRLLISCLLPNKKKRVPKVKARAAAAATGWVEDSKENRGTTRL